MSCSNNERVMMENVVPMPRIECGPGTKISKPEELDTGRWVVRGYRRHREDGTWVWYETKMFVVMAELVIDP